MCLHTTRHFDISWNNITGPLYWWHHAIESYKQEVASTLNNATLNNALVLESVRKALVEIQERAILVKFSGVNEQYWDIPF